MQITNIRETKTHLSKLIARVIAGEEIIIGKAGKPVAKLIPYEESDEPRRSGQWRSKVKIADDFDELLQDRETPDGRAAMLKLCKGLGKGPADLATNHDHYLYGGKKTE